MCLDYLLPPGYPCLSLPSRHEEQGDPALSEDMACGLSSQGLHCSHAARRSLLPPDCPSCLSLQVSPGQKGYASEGGHTGKSEEAVWPSGTPASSCFPDAWVWLRMQPERFTLSLKEACVGGESPLGTGSMGQPRARRERVGEGRPGRSGDGKAGGEVSPTGPVDEPAGKGPCRQQGSWPSPGG